MKLVRSIAIMTMVTVSSFATGIVHEWIYDYNYTDNVPPSQNPPQGLKPEQVPQFVTIGFDDNSKSGRPEKPTDPMPENPEGLAWALKFFDPLVNPAGTGNIGTYDGTPVRVAFYNTSYYASGYNGDNPALIRKIWHDLYANGHEAGNHTQSHSESLKKGSAEVWRNEVQTCMSWQEKPLAPEDMELWQQAESSEYGAGIPRKDIVGFRTPFLAYGGPLFPTLKEEGLIYDCTIEEGNSYEQDGTDFRWPYTLDSGSPGHKEGWSGNPENPDHFTVPEVPGFWQLPNHVAVIPTVEESKKFGVDHSIKDVILKNIKWFDENSTKITMFDYNLWVQAKLSNAEVLAILKHNLDLRLKGNRAPLMIGAHSEYFHSEKSSSCTNATDVFERQKVFEEFIKYALSHPMVRVVRPIDIISWCRNPVPLQGGSVALSDNAAPQKSSFSIKNGVVKLDQINGSRKAVTMTLFSPQGRMLAKESMAVQNGSVSWSPLTNAANGVYFLNIEGLGSQKFLVK